jgi:hypothetical protein
MGLERRADSDVIDGQTTPWGDLHICKWWESVIMCVAVLGHIILEQMMLLHEMMSNLQATVDNVTLKVHQFSK